MEIYSITVRMIESDDSVAFEIRVEGRQGPRAIFVAGPPTARGRELARGMAEAWINKYLSDAVKH